ncbi:MAG: ABC transporter permease [Planctomycetes bacterium]|nr:ABC transporter permease [Planctomycetota bacterium]
MRGDPRRAGYVARLAILAAFLFAAMTVLAPDRFPTARNLSSMGFQLPELGIFAIAIAISLISGGIDLSVVSAANLSGIVAALILTGVLPADAGALATAAGVAGAIAAALATGIACGAVNGILIARAGITPILATLGTMELFMGLGFVLTKGPAIHGFPRAFLFIGSGTIVHVPAPLIVLLAVAVAASVALDRTAPGIRIRLAGTSERAALFSGIDVGQDTIRTYVATGLLAAVAGIILISRVNSAKPDYGTSYLLQAVLVAILGGVRPTGGFGSIPGLVIALLSLQFISSGFNMLRASQYLKEFAWGALLLIAMVTNAAIGGRRGRSRPASSG